MVGQFDEARAHYEQAISICTQVRFRPAVAFAKLHLAELLLDHYPDEHAEAIEHLDFAISEFRDMKMQPYLECALRHREKLNA